MPWIIGGLGLAGDVLGGIFGSSSAAKANKTNLKLQKDQQQWEAMMSNTAVQRRANDIEAAGGNRALAFTGGQSASTPSVSPASVEPTFRPEWLKGSAGTAAMLALQTDNLKAQTYKTVQEGRVNKVEADIREGLKSQELDARLNAFVEKHDWDDLKTAILRNTRSSSAAQAKIAEETVNEAIRQLKAGASIAELNEKNLQRITNMQGLTWKDILSIAIQIGRD